MMLNSTNTNTDTDGAANSLVIKSIEKVGFFIRNFVLYKDFFVFH